MSKSTLPSARLSRDDVARLRSQIVVTASCHLWMGSIGGEGYGKFWVPYLPQEQAAHDGRRGRVITPHAAASALVLGPLPEGSTHLHDCDVRICVSTAPGHVRRGTQRENVRQAVARGYLRGPRPGRADARGPAGASHAIQDAIRAAVTTGEKDPAALGRVLAEMFAAGFPTVDVVPLFPEPAHIPAVYVSDFPVDLFAVPPLPVVLWSAASETVPLFQLYRSRRPHPAGTGPANVGIAAAGLLPVSGLPTLQHADTMGISVCGALPGAQRARRHRRRIGKTSDDPAHAPPPLSGRRTRPTGRRASLRR